ncbi:A24 family peptidase [Asticcacaulis machinosus]|uniref:Prepilin peptidase n=1 Tax=Asticcacaulis machinosus TaxID=2984211 RepID=A0ABT5HM83_9CAUL|nr:prepilin peptidase [Asticcacaulis machinosus]MDC7677123.1 prepilin peptidase [Asticcacaulis machinosus]
MTLLNISVTAFMLIYPACLLWAAISDIRTMTISNRLCLILAGGFYPAALLLGLSLPLIGLHTLLAFGVLLAGMAMFAAGWMGGGDAKLMTAASLWLGLSATLPFVFYVAIAGGALTLLFLILRKVFKRTETMTEWQKRLMTDKGGVPYGVAIFAGALLAAPHGALFKLAGL